MSVGLVGYAYPWDVGARLDRVLDMLRPDRIALAGLYHAVRALDRSGSQPRVVDAWHTASYLPDRAWKGLPLRPPAPNGWSRADAFVRARESLRERELPVDAWLVLNHIEHAPEAQDWSVVTALGQRLHHTQCCSHPAVIAHMRAAVEAALIDGAADGLVLEAVAPLGAAHPVAHDKSRGIFSDPVVRELSSWCFCSACTERRGDRSEDARRVIVAALERAIAPDDPRVCAAREYLTHDRTRAASDALVAVVARARELECDRIAVFAGAAPRAFTPSVPIEAVASGTAEVVIGSAWGSAEATAAEFAALAGHRRGLSINVMEGGSSRGITDLLEQWPVDEVHLYHLGLADDSELRAWAR